MGVEWSCNSCGLNGHNLRPPFSCPHCHGLDIWNEHHDERWSDVPPMPEFQRPPAMPLADVMAEAADALSRCTVYGEDGRPLVPPSPHTATKLIEYHRPAGMWSVMVAEQRLREWWWASLHTACLMMAPPSAGDTPFANTIKVGELPEVYRERATRAFFVYGGTEGRMTFSQAVAGLNRCGAELKAIREVVGKLGTLAARMGGPVL